MNPEFKLNNGSVLLVAESPGGLYNSEQLRVVAELAHGKQVAMVRALEDQRLGLVAKADKLEIIRATLAEVGLGIRHYQHALHQPIACMGSACPKANQDALGMAMQIAAIEDKFAINEPLKIGINGCAASCVPAHSLDISIVGEAKGYRMSIGGKSSLLPEYATFIAQGIPEPELPELVEKVITAYAENREEDETFHDVLERLGISMFIDLLHPYSQDAGGHDLDLATASTAMVNPSPATEEDDFDLDDLPHADEFEDGAGSNAVESSVGTNLAADEDLALEAMEPESIEEETESIDLSGVVDQALISDEATAEGDLLEPEASAFLPDDAAMLDAAAEIEAMDEFDDYSLQASVEDEGLPEIQGEEVLDSEDEEGLEAKITQSIDEESLISYDDRSDKHRIQAVEMVEAIASKEPISEPDDLDAEFEGDEVLSDFEVNLANEIDFDRTARQTQNGFTIQSVNQDGAKVVINFSSGASIAIDIDQLKSMSGRMELVFNKQKVSLVEEDGTILLKSNGIEFRLPCQVAA